MTAVRADASVIWEATQRLGLYRLTNAQLEALISNASGPQPDAQLLAEAAHYVRELRLGLANGNGC
jgi:hypothetical protein